MIMKDFDYLSFITALRRKFHQIPEIAYNEFETQAEIIKELEQIGIKYKRAGTGIIARLNTGKQKTIAFRADIDALPIEEANDVPYKSKNKGFMHACGHDGHIAMLLAFIHWCKNNPDEMAANAVFIFQPAEEAEGGAITMIEQGALDDVDEIYAIHVDPSLKEGCAGLRAGVSMAGAYEFDIFCEGESCHCAEKRLGKDAVHAIIDITEGIYNSLTSTESIFHCGKICGGYARNIVADKAVANCTIRYFDEKDLNDILFAAKNEMEKAQTKYGVKCGISLLTNYIPLVNNPDCCEKVKKHINSEELPLRFTAEDFAFYLKEVKGCIIWLGTEGGMGAKKLHSTDFDFEEKALLHGFYLFRSLMVEEKI